MATRRQAREWAVQILFALDASARTSSCTDEDLSVPTVLEDFWKMQLHILNEERPDGLRIEASQEEELAEKLYTEGWQDLLADGPTRRFCESIVQGVVDHLSTIDRTISASAPHWSIDRMGGVERSALRMGVYEILYCSKDVPPPVAINEAIDICKYFGMRDSARFVNGILDHIAKHRTAAEAGETWSPRQA